VRLEAVSKMHLTSNGCVAIRFKVLTYCVYAALLNLIDALEAYLNLLRLDMSSRFAGPLNVTYNFETASISYLKNSLNPLATLDIKVPYLCSE